MPEPIKPPKFKDIKPINIDWNNWAKGLNTLVAPTKIRDDELSIAKNIVLVDEGTPIKRGGTANFGNSSGDNGLQGIFPYYNSNGSHELLTIDGGFLKKYNPNTEDWSLVTGASFASGIRTSGVVAQDSLYLSNGIDPLTKYDGINLNVFAALSAPGSNWASLATSLASGPYLYSYRVTAVNNIGETLAAAATTVSVNKRRDTWNPDETTPSDNRSIVVNWNKVIGATGYNIYGVDGGDETYIDHVDGNQVTKWVDYGITPPSAFFELPVANTTTGPKGKFIIEFKSSLIIGGDEDNPSRVYYSAGLDKIDSFSIADGGGYVDISKNSNDGKVSGLAKYQNNVVLMKERSVWQMDFNESAIPSISNIVNDIGCVSHFTIIEVENDLYFLGRKIGGGPAIYVLGNEPNYLNVLRTNELSARVRPDLMSVTPLKMDQATAVYYDGKYHLFLPEGGSNLNNIGIVYDRERLGFTRFEDIYVSNIAVYYDSNNEEYLLFTAGDDGRVSRISDAYTTDKGAAIQWSFKTKESDLDAPFLYKKFKWINLRFRNVKGTIRLRFWTDSNKIAYTTSINSETFRTAFRDWNFGVGSFGRLVDEDSAAVAISTLIRRFPLSRQGTVAIARSLAVEIYGTEVDSKAGLLDVNIDARPKSVNFYPRSEVINS